MELLQESLETSELLRQAEGPVAQLERVLSLEEIPINRLKYYVTVACYIIGHQWREEQERSHHGNETPTHP